MRVAVRLLLALLLFTTACFGTGRIKGRVYDKQTNEPLVGANVFIPGTSYGSATAPDGSYLILEVPAGLYKVTARYIGYSSMTIEDLRVFNDLTTETDFSLTSEAVAIQDVVVTAERPLVNPSATNAVRITTADQIATLPVRSVNEILSLMPGVNYQDGNIYIRGGRVDETGFYLEGVSVTDPQYGGRGVTIPSQAIEEISVQSAGYEAEYGRANSGIVQSQLKTAGSEFNTFVEFITDNISLAGQNTWAQGIQRLGTTWYGYSDFNAAVSTPLFGEAVKVFGLFNHIYLGDQDPRPWPGSNLGTVVDPSTGDSVDLNYPRGIKLNNSKETYTGTATLMLDFRPLQLRFSGSYSKALSFLGAHFWPGDDRSRIPRIDNKDGFGSLKATYFFSPTIFAELSGGWFGYSSKISDPILTDNFLAYGDSVTNAEAGVIWNRSPGDPTGRFAVPPMNHVYGLYWFVSPGQPVSEYLMINRSNFSLNAGFSAQLGRNHMLKVGGDYQKYTIRTYEVGNPADLARLIGQNDALPVGDPSKLTLEQIMIRNNVNNYGYDVLGRTDNSYSFIGPRRPAFASAYIQDRMDFSDLVVNVGLRYDYINTNAFVPIDPTRPELTRDPVTNEVHPEGLRKSTPFNSLSPRLGIAYPVTDRTVFHVQYSKLVQQSRLRDVNLGLYADAVFSSLTSSPIGFDLRPERTTQYEIGFTQQLGDFASIDVTGYYKDIKDQIVMRSTEPARTSSYALPYGVYANGDFATTKGIELTFTMRRYKRLMVNGSLSFQDARGSGSFPNSNWGIIGAGTDTTFTPYYTSPLNYMNALRGNISFDYRFGRDDGGPILSELGVSLLWTFNSGHPYTRSSPNSLEFNARYRTPIESMNSSTTPWVYQADLRVDKTIRFTEDFSATVSLYVINLFDTRNVLNVWSQTGSADDDGFLSNPDQSGSYFSKYGQQFADVYRLINLSYVRPPAYFNDPYLCGPPRQIRLGLRLEY
jgi:outer membrane receptor protein involved in Fe transport